MIASYTAAGKEQMAAPLWANNPYGHVKRCPIQKPYVA
jgi:hypothetical protein